MCVCMLVFQFNYLKFFLLHSAIIRRIKTYIFLQNYEKLECIFFSAEKFTWRHWECWRETFFTFSEFFHSKTGSRYHRSDETGDMKIVYMKKTMQVHHYTVKGCMTRGRTDWRVYRSEGNDITRVWASPIVPARFAVETCRIAWFIVLLPSPCPTVASRNST